MSKVFISYRRVDTGHISQTIYEKLCDHFGADNIFFDVDSVPLGADFKEYIISYVKQCNVLLVIIGKDWLGQDQNGNSRIHAVNDLIRFEIEAALDGDIPIMPVLIDGVSMPSEASLPPLNWEVGL